MSGNNQVKVQVEIKKRKNVTKLRKLKFYYLDMRSNFGLTGCLSFVIIASFQNAVIALHAEGKIQSKFSQVLKVPS